MIHFHVSLQVPFFNERLATQGTNMRLFARMGAHMRYQVSFAYKIFRALFATEWSFNILAFCVTALMEDKISFEREGLSARFTGERPIPGMAPRHMVYQMLLSCKWLIADIAAMRIIA